jgi:hypothetical protein
MSSIEKESKDVILRDFWKSHSSDFHPEFKGDVTKTILIELLNSSFKDSKERILLTSVHNNPALWSKIFSRHSSNKSIPEKLESDLLRQYGHFSTPAPKQGNKNIWFTGENIRPPLHQSWDKFLSFDLDDFGGRNLYLPLWALRLSETVQGAEQFQNMMVKSRAPIEMRESKICAVISNPEPVRMNFIRALQKYITVDLYGRTGLPIENKRETLSKYQFNICFENDLYPGYVTEKPLEAYLSGCIPIWRGLDSGEYLNDSSMIDLTKKNLKSGVDEVMNVLSEPDLVSSISSQPFLKKQIDYRALKIGISAEPVI